MSKQKTCIDHLINLPNLVKLSEMWQKNSDS